MQAKAQPCDEQFKITTQPGDGYTLTISGICEMGDGMALIQYTRGRDGVL